MNCDYEQASMHKFNRKNKVQFQERDIGTTET